ncbi:MAG TPA: PD-(D/E)XK nuclease family protein [Blastocatellia bacterium]|nr:PD-(D/E)XK nuclease family protein [Blastocatellia bacterium]
MKALIGPANSGKSERVISRVAKAILESRGRVYLIAPSSRASSVLLEKLVAKLAGSEINAPRQAVVTFQNLYSDILGKLNRKLTWLNLIDRDRLLRRIIHNLSEAGKLDYFAETAAMPGFITAVAGFIDELWRSGTSPDAFNLIAQLRSEKDRDLALIYESYAAELDSLNATDSEAAGFMALQTLESSASINLNISLVAVDGFDFYSPVQLRLLSLLAARNVETIVTLTYEEGRAVHLWQKPTIERLRKTGAQFDYCSTTPTNVIERAAAQLMDDEATPASDESKPDDAICIISAPDRATEARAVAREIKRLVIEKDFAANDIAIVCRSLSLYAHHLERIFDECSIPLALDSALGLAENPAILAMLRLLNLSAASFPRRALIECLRSPYFNLSSFGLNEASIDLLDCISLEKNVTQGRDQWLSAIESFASDKERNHRRSEHDQVDKETVEERQKRFATLRANLNSFFIEITPQASATRDEFVHWTTSLLEKFCVDECANVGATASRDKKALELFRTTVGALDASGIIVRLTGEAQWSNFYAELERAIAAVTSDREPPSSLALVAQEAHNSRPRRARALFVLGLVEGEFPAKSAERAPYTIIEREELRRSGIDLTETSTDAGADLTQFYKAMSRASERLYLAHSRTDLTGGELLPSYLIEEVSAVASAKQVRIAQGVNQSISRDAASLEELARLTAHAIGDSASEGRLFVKAVDDETLIANAFLDRELPSWRATRRGASVEFGRLYGRGLDVYDGIINERALVGGLKKRFGPEHLWSASQINDYGTCPFRFFAKHVLRLDSPSEPGEGFTPNRLGMAYHEILEHLYLRLESNKILVSTESPEAVVPIVEEVAEEVLQKLLDEGAIRKNALWDFDKSEIKRRIVRLLHKESEWNDETPAKPVHFERRFGIGGTEPLVIETEDGQVRLRGQIDRIDKREDGLVVIDYKTKRTPIRHNDALDGRDLQLPIYAMAASRVIEKGETVASAYYLHIHSRKKGSELPHKDISVEGLIEHAENRIRDYVSRARNGQFPIKPNDNRCYTGCEFDVMCRIGSLGSSTDDE